MAKKSPANLPAAIPIPFKTLVDLLGKPVDDPAVKAILAKVGKTKIDSDFIVAKEAGFDYSLDRKVGVKKKVLDTLFVFAHGGDGHSGYEGLPKPFAFVARAALCKAAKPDGSWSLDDGDLPAGDPASERDSWKRDGYVIDANYGRSDGIVRHFTVQQSEEDRGGRDISTHPLHFETEPVDAPPKAELVGMALIVAWSADRFGLPKKHATSSAGKQLAKRTISPVAFLEAECAKTLTTVDIAPELGDFFYGYTNRLFLGSRAPDRDKTAGDLKKILNLHRADERAYTDDFLGTFKGVVKNPFHVPDSWTSVDRIAPILDARWADFQATGMKTAPDLAAYKKAAKLRDGVKIEAAKAAIKGVIATDDALAPALIALIGKPVKEVAATLTSAGLPIGKTIDEQANPAAGIGYMGSKLKIGGKSVLCVTHVDFYAAKQKSYIRGLGKEVEFLGYASPIVLGVSIGDSRADVAKAFGKPKSTSDERDYWYPDKEHRISAAFSKSGKLVFMHFGLVEDWEETKPTPPFGPKGIY